MQTLSPGYTRTEFQQTMGLETQAMAERVGFGPTIHDRGPEFPISRPPSGSERATAPRKNQAYALGQPTTRNGPAASSNPGGPNRLVIFLAASRSEQRELHQIRAPFVRSQERPPILDFNDLS